MVAPLVPGSYTSIWRVRDSFGTPFGSNFTVVINVSNAPLPPLATNSPRPPTPTHTVTPAPGAPVITFFTCAPCVISAGQSTTLSWGAVTGATSATLDPGSEGAGVATFVFLNGARSGPADADVDFKDWIRHPSGPNDSRTIHHAYYGSLGNLNWSLAPWTGQTANFILEVDAKNANARRDWACWVSAKIMRS